MQRAPRLLDQLDPHAEFHGLPECARVASGRGRFAAHGLKVAVRLTAWVTSRSMAWTPEQVVAWPPIRERPWSATTLPARIAPITGFGTDQSLNFRLVWSPS